MPQMEELAARLNVTEDELLDAVADTGYELVPSAEGPEMAGDEGPLDPMAAEEDAAVEDMEAGEASEAVEDVTEGMEEMSPMGLPPLPGMSGEERVSESENPRMKMKMLVMDASKKALEKGKRK